MEDEKLFGQILGREIRLRRPEKGQSIEELAFKVGLDEKHLGKFERKGRNIYSHTLYRLSRELNTSVDRIFKEVDKEMDSRPQNDSE